MSASVNNSDGGCRLCGAPLDFLFSKKSAEAEIFDIYSCTDCQLWQIHPLPSQAALNALYQNRYFEKRTDRGYDTYTSEKIKKSVVSTLEKNLTDLNFFEYEKNLKQGRRRSLEIGSAAGYFVEYMHERGWHSEGIDVAEKMVNAARRRGLNVHHGDFLQFNLPKESYDLVVLWATLEHLRDFQAFLTKAAGLLKPGACLYLTTCNTGFFAQIYGEAWRYLNVPEHLYYFNRDNLKLAGRQAGLELEHSFTYGSGFTTREDAGFFYNLMKPLADTAAKFFHSGDMIALSFRKPE